VIWDLLVEVGVEGILISKNASKLFSTLSEQERQVAYTFVHRTGLVHHTAIRL
jgi:hypothetical protein